MRPSMRIAVTPKRRQGRNAPAARRARPCLECTTGLHGVIAREREKEVVAGSAAQDDRSLRVDGSPVIRIALALEPPTGLRVITGAWATIG